jgi:hypothetical protein
MARSSFFEDLPMLDFGILEEHHVVGEPPPPPCPSGLEALPLGKPPRSWGPSAPVALLPLGMSHADHRGLEDLGVANGHAVEAHQADPLPGRVDLSLARSARYPSESSTPTSSQPTLLTVVAEGRHWRGGRPRYSSLGGPRSGGGRRRFGTGRGPPSGGFPIPQISA